MVITPYRWVISRKNTAIAERTMPTPTQKISRNSKGIQNSTNVQQMVERVTTITTKIATRLKLIVTKHDNTLDIGKINLGIYTFLINAPLLRTEYIAILVLSLKNENSVLPQIRYNGKFSILDLNIKENTIVIIVIIRSGFSKLQR